MPVTLAPEQDKHSEKQMLTACALCYFNIEFPYIIYITSLRGQ